VPQSLIVGPPALLVTPALVGIDAQQTYWPVALTVLAATDVEM